MTIVDDVIVEATDSVSRFSPIVKRSIATKSAVIATSGSGEKSNIVGEIDGKCWSNAMWCIPQLCDLCDVTHLCDLTETEKNGCFQNLSVNMVSQLEFGDQAQKPKWEQDFAQKHSDKGVGIIMSEIK